eukprot:3053178-Pleurochrysis_carterae.AAC.3
MSVSNKGKDELIVLQYTASGRVFARAQILPISQMKSTLLSSTPEHPKSGTETAQNLHAVHYAANDVQRREPGGSCAAATACSDCGGVARRGRAARGRRRERRLRRAHAVKSTARRRRRRQRHDRDGHCGASPPPAAGVKPARCAGRTARPHRRLDVDYVHLWAKAHVHAHATVRATELARTNKCACVQHTRTRLCTRARARTRARACMRM